MRWLFSFLLLALLGVVQALSSSGSRLLVILEEESERENYSVLLEDLSSMYTCSFLNN
jgi:oligosaccharyltransferase complex subunit beta